VGDIAVPKIGLLRQLGDVRRDPPRLVAREQLGTMSASLPKADISWAGTSLIAAALVETLLWTRGGAEISERRRIF
jgi:hypothetical protein